MPSAIANLPNLLTFSRILLTVLFWWLCDQITVAGALWAAIVFGLAALTDLFDGMLARKTGQITTFGKILDPIADKVLILTAMFVFAGQEILVWWMVILVAVREILVTASRIFLLTKGRVIPAEAAGKFKTVWQMNVIVLVLAYRVLWIWPATEAWMQNYDVMFSLVINVFMVASVVFTWWSGGLYFRDLLRPAMPKPNKAGAA